MAPAGAAGRPPACPACSRQDSARAFFCRDCLDSCLADHRVRRQHLKNALTLVASRANALLAGADRTATHARGSVLGVAEERQLKADKWALASRAYAAREAVGKAKAANEHATDELEARRAALTARRANLSTARSLLSSLSSPSPSTSSLSLHDSLPALLARINNLSESLSALDAETSRVRRILALELLSVYALAPLERPLADPFLSASLSRLAYPPTTSSNAQQTQAYTLAHLPLPALSALVSLPRSTLEALLAHLAHLTRLLALYARTALPYTPLPGAFGPGRAGIRAAPGWALEDAEAGEPVGGRRRSALGTEVWPLVFGSRRRPRDSAAETAAAAEDDDGEGDGGGGYDDERTTARSERSDTSAGASAVGAATAGTKRGKRARLVLGGAVALAVDLAFLIWMRDTREGRAHAWRIEELDDLGALASRAAGAAGTAGDKGAAGDEGGEREGALDSSLALESFPLSLADAVAHYNALAFGATSTPMSQAGRSRGGLEESGVVVEGEEDGEDDDDEGWDLVSV